MFQPLKCDNDPQALTTYDSNDFSADGLNTKCMKFIILYCVGSKCLDMPTVKLG